MAGVFGTSSIDLSMCGNDGQQLTANVYMLEGVQNADGSLRELSMSQLVLAICLSRATHLETQIVETMEGLAETSHQLELLTDLDQDMVNWVADTNHKSKGDKWQNNKFADALGLMGKGANASFTYEEVESFIRDIEAKMDSLNSTSQTTLIQIQSLTSKRDDTYSLVSNVLKSINTVLIGSVNNL